MIRLAAPLAALAALALSACSGAEEVHHVHAAAEPSGTEQRSLVVLSDQPMLDQHGETRRLKSDVAGQKIIVVDFIFTSCQTICPVTTALLAESHRRLADVPAEDLAFVSMSIDANVDTPERLAAFAGRHRANWTFLTGEKRIMDEALVWLNAYATNPEDHAAMILIGDGATGSFSRIYGLPDPVFVEARVRELLANRADYASLHQH
ncbi:MAG: SCO family protein [Hyphomonas sp.]